ncbi:MAG: hypothetical protein U5K32_00525 [Bacteroidales bacterium]|nr:hypothetical protein [Bacteroidales bacterium]
MILFMTQGSTAVRGSIIDIFSFASDRPCRIDFFGDDVESIRSFNPDRPAVRRKDEGNIYSA